MCHWHYDATCHCTRNPPPFYVRNSSSVDSSKKKKIFLKERKTLESFTPCVDVAEKDILTISP